MLRSIVLPESVILSLKGERIERILDEERLHGWGWTCTGVDYCEYADTRKNADPNRRMAEIILKIDRESAEKQVCFRV